MIISLRGGKLNCMAIMQGVLLSYCSFFSPPIWGLVGIEPVTFWSLCHLVTIWPSHRYVLCKGLKMYENMSKINWAFKVQHSQIFLWLCLWVVISWLGMLNSVLVRLSNPHKAEIFREFCSTCVNLAVMSTLTVHRLYTGRWKGERVRERFGHPPLFAEAKKMKSLTIHTHGCLRDSLIKGMLFFTSWLTLEMANFQGLCIQVVAVSAGFFPVEENRLIDWLIDWLIQNILTGTSIPLSQWCILPIPSYFQKC